MYNICSLAVLSGNMTLFGFFKECIFPEFQTIHDTINYHLRKDRKRHASCSIIIVLTPFLNISKIYFFIHLFNDVCGS